MSARTALPLIGVLAVSAMLALASAPVAAQEVRLSAPGTSEDLQDRLRATSLLFREPEEGVTRTGEDIVAAARADYGRMIGVLYEEGFFAPVITISLDGRDAAGISPFDPPATVRTVEIAIDTGAPFRLGEARIGPLAADTDLPAGFRSGEPATTPLLRDTTEAALDAWQRQGNAFADVGE
jgi:translocation and assembly module TamA